MRDALNALQSALKRKLEPKELAAAFSDDPKLNLPLSFGNREAAAFFRYQTFAVARITSQDILDDLRKSLAVALESGIGFDKWKKSAVALLEKRENILPNYRLRTIYKTNVGLAYAGGQIAALEQSKDDFPMWEFKAVMDGKTRREHQILNGKIFENGDWTYFPPVGFNCRCRARIIPASKAKSLAPSIVSDNEKSQIKNADFIGNKNAAFARWVEQKKKGLPETIRQAIDQQERKLIAELGFAPKDFIQKKYLEFAKNSDYKEIAASKNAFVFQHIRAHKKDLKENLAAAKILYQNGYSVAIKEHKLANNPNPEYVIYNENNEWSSDLKTPQNPKSIRSRFNAAEKQGLFHVVIVAKTDWTINELENGLIRAFSFNKKISESVVIRNQKAMTVKRADYEAGKIYEKIKPLYQEDQRRP